MLESVLLDDLRDEIEPDLTQYGEVKNCSVDHLLVDLHEAVLNSLDEGNSVVVAGIDFEKAFNWLYHWECLHQLCDLGASTTLIGLVRTFLCGRSMRVKIGDVFSDARLLNGGSPRAPPGQYSGMPPLLSGLPTAQPEPFTLPYPPALGNG